MADFDWASIAAAAAAWLAFLFSLFQARSAGRDAREARAQQLRATRAQEQAAESQRAAVEAQQRATNAAEQVVEIERAREVRAALKGTKASLSATLRRASRLEELVLRNDGEAAASNIRLFINGKPALESGLRLGRLPERIEGRSEVPIVVALSSETGTSFDVTIEWDDDSGEPGRWIQIVSLGG